MIITRKIGKFFRGRATPTQIFLACGLGAAMGFLPAFELAPGAWIALAAALLVLNANLGLALLALAGGHLLSLVLLPTSFALGRWLIDGPAEGFVRWAANAPVLAFFGLEYYATTGGLVLGLVFGCVLGVLAVTLLQSVRRQLARLELESARYATFTAKPWVRVGAFLFLGGKKKGKKSYGELAQKRFGNPIRPVGVGLVAVLLLGGYFFQQLWSSPILTHALKTELSRANGATVDVANVDLDLRGGRLTIEGLAAADPEALERDVFRAGKLEADLDTTHLLSKRFVIDRLAVHDAFHGAQREKPGRIVGEPREPQEKPRPAGEESKSIEDYLEEAEIWKERLAQARRWMEKLERPSDDGSTPDTPESRREELERRARELGYARVRADHLIEKAPLLVVREISVEGLKSAALPAETLDLNARDLSTHPALWTAPPHLQLASRSDKLGLSVGLAPQGKAAGGAAKPADSEIKFHYRDLPTDQALGWLNLGEETPLGGGTLDLEIDGAWDGRVGEVDLPLEVTAHGLSFGVPGQGTQTLDELVLPIGLSGPIDDPAIDFEMPDIAQQMLNQAKAELEARVRAEADALADKAQAEVDELQKQAEQEADALADEATKKAARELEKSLGRELPGGVENQAKELLGGWKKKVTVPPVKKKDG